MEDRQSYLVGSELELEDGNSAEGQSQSQGPELRVTAGVRNQESEQRVRPGVRNQESEQRVSPGVRNQEESRAEASLGADKAQRNHCCGHVC